ncbi:MAG: flagellar brake protein [Armatimonadota bacterium]|nr:flagellar brake protein [Armatimonadota bacterium]MDR7404405.1 flagellar brake protein [Armatimonadota bacterium]
MITESPEARRERQACPVCRCPQRRMIERMRQISRVPYRDILATLDPAAGISLRSLIRHFTRGHTEFAPAEDLPLPSWLLEDETELDRYMREAGFCRTIEDLCPHVPPGVISTCERIGHAECARFRLYTFRERLLDAEGRAGPPSPEASRPTEAVSLTEPLTVHQAVEVESLAGTQGGVFASTVLAIEPDAIRIALPTRLTETLSLTPGDRLAVQYQGRISKYAFETTVRAVRGREVDLAAPASVGIASRRSPRVRLRDSAVRVIRVEQGGREVAGVALDASLQGVRVQAAADLVLWERVRVIVSLPDGPLAADGEVVRVEPSGADQRAYGIYFIGLGADSLARLRRLGG